MLGCGGHHAFAHETLLLLFSHFVRRIVQFCRFFSSTSRERGLLLRRVVDGHIETNVGSQISNND